MLFNPHPTLPDKHAFLSPSSYHWLNYDDQKLEARFHTVVAARRGVDLHKLAHDAIRLKVPFAGSNKALAEYVKDGIRYDMLCEQPLYYSDNCFGTPDTICFRRRKLRIHDLKTGITSVSMKQLEVYDALFCLEYGVDPFSIEHELRIYQRDDVSVFNPPPELIASHMETIVHANQVVEEIKEALW